MGWCGQWTPPKTVSSMTDFFWATPTKNLKILYMYWKVKILKITHILWRCAQTHPINKTCLCPFPSKGEYQRCVNKGYMWPKVSPGTETRGKNLRKNKTKKTLHGHRNRLLKKSQISNIWFKTLNADPPPTKILTTPLFWPTERRSDGQTDRRTPFFDYRS